MVILWFGKRLSPVLFPLELFHGEDDGGSRASFCPGSCPCLANQALVGRLAKEIFNGTVGFRELVLLLLLLRYEDRGDGVMGFDGNETEGIRSGDSVLLAMRDVSGEACCAID